MRYIVGPGGGRLAAMSTSSPRDNPTPADAEGLHFADPAAAALLRPHVGELCAPPAEQWRQVKHNASRTVYHGHIDGREMYLKHFHDRSLSGWLLRRMGLSGALRELDLSQRLAGARVGTASVLAAMCNATVEWVLTDAVAPGPALDAWHAEQLARGAAGRRAMGRMSLLLAKLLAATHAAGVVHRDLHCGNVMVGPGGGPVLMDLHRASHKRFVSRRLRVMNLAQLCHDRTPFTSRSRRLRFLKQYLRASGTGGTLRGWELLISQQARRHTRRQNVHRDRRIFRRNKYFAPIKLSDHWGGHVVLATKRPHAWSQAAGMTFTVAQWCEALGDVEGLFTADGVEVVKDTPSGVVVRRELTVGCRPVRVFIKRPRPKGLKKLFACFRRSRPRRAFSLGHKLLTRLFATALPLAVLERRCGPFVLDSILVTEAVDGPVAWRYLADGLAGRGPDEQVADGRRRRRQAHDVLWSLGRAVRRLHEAGFTHRDLKTVNLVMHPASPAPEVVFIDLDGASRPPVVTAYRRLRDLSRLVRALLQAPPHVSSAGRMRVVRGYLAAPGAGEGTVKVTWRVMEEFGADGKQFAAARGGGRKGGAQ